MKMNKKVLGRSAAVVLSVSALALASVPVFAKDNKVKPAEVAASEDEKNDVDVSGFLKSQGIEVTDADLEELSKAGIVLPDGIDGIEGVDFSNAIELKDTDTAEIVYDGAIVPAEVDFGDLTEEEKKELQSIYDRFEEISKEAFGENLEADDAQAEAVFKKYEAELEKLEERALELEKKAGWAGEVYETEIIDVDDQELGEIIGAVDKISNLSEEDLAEVETLLGKAEEIGLVSVILDEKTTDAHMEAFIKEHETELKELNDSAEELEEKIVNKSTDEN